MSEDFKPHFKHRLIQLRTKISRSGLMKAVIHRSKWIEATLHAKSEEKTGVSIQTVKSVPTEKSKYKLGIFVRVYNEAFGIQEFIAFHLAQGVEHFYIYNNASKDNTVEKLQPFIDRGVVTLETRTDKPMSPAADTHCMNTYGHECEWIACIDADEFLFAPDGRQLPDVLKEYKQFPAVVAAWVYYGSAGHKKRPAELVIESYNRSAGEVDVTVKSIVQPSKLLKYGNSHFWYYRSFQQAVDENYNSTLGPSLKNPTANKLRINHYFCKSLEDYMLKVDPTYAVDKIGSVLPNRTAEKVDMQMNSHNDVEDLIMQPFIARTKEILAEYVGNS
ncbi:MAG: glycosyltransferase family 2 protein [Fimbriimonadaceae bacterium]